MPPTPDKGTSPAFATTGTTFTVMLLMVAVFDASVKASVGVVPNQYGALDISI